MKPANLYPNYLVEYRERIRSGEIIAGRELKKELDKLVADLNDDRYQYDTTEAHLRIEFMENLCLQSKKPFYMQPMKLLLWEKAFIEVIYSFKKYSDECGRWIRRFQDIMLLIARKNGKALALDTRIPTPDGDKTMRDIKTGDYVFGAKGQPVRVIATSQIFVGHDCYKVVFEDGEEITADSDHLWSVQTKENRRKGKGCFTVKTSDMLDDFKRIRKDHKGIEYKYRVPVPEPVKYSERKYQIPPYLLGVWLGDGYSNSNRIACGDQDVKEIVENINKTGVETSRKWYKTAWCVRVGTKCGRYNAIKTALKEYGLLNNKHIPQEYLFGSVEQRTELLQGIMDTDGTASKAGQCEITQKNKRLIDDISKLLTSLGIKHSTKVKYASCNGKKIKNYRIMFYVPKEFSCFKLERHQRRLKDHLSDRTKYKSIVDIRPTESVPTKCLYVEGGLYLCGEKNTVTHNTTLLAADAHTDLRIGDGGQDIVCASNDDKQASLLWNECDGMRKRIDPKGKWTHKNMSEIKNLTNDTKIFKLSSKTQNKDGRNIDKTYFDESHDAENDEIAAACQKSMSVKEEPLFINLTTEGFVNDGYLDNKLVYARKVLNDEIDDDTFLPWLYTQDSESEIWQDENSWYKSNPSLGVIKKWSYLRGEVAKSKVEKSTRMHTLCKDFNIKQNNAQAWLMEDDYNYPTPVYDLEDFRDAVCLGAVDLSATTDLSNAKILLMKPDDKTKYVYSHYWIPESKMEDSNDKEAGAQYLEWAKEGILTIHEGNEIDISRIADWFYGLYKSYGLRLYKCGYDQRYAKTFLDKMSEYGFDCEMIYQNRFVMSSPMKLVEADLKSKLINYNQNAMDKWCLGNAAMEMDNYGNVMCVKVNNQRSKQIDGAVTLIILYETFRRSRNEFMQAVNRR